MAMPGKRSGKRSSKRARVQCAHLQNSRSFSAVKVMRDPSAAMIESEARSGLTSQAGDSAAIGVVVDISKSFAAMLRGGRPHEQQLIAGARRSPVLEITCLSAADIANTTSPVPRGAEQTCCIDPGG